ncbi:MAG TPA: UPF0175 family protein [Chitinophagales bacterium]|nr:UPF0175 family protein [Chitinophagales bacterium]
MSITIDDELLRDTALTEDDLKREIAVALFERHVFTFAQARRFSGMDRLAFEKFLAEKKIGIYSYENYLEDASTVKKLST